MDGKHLSRMLAAPRVKPAPFVREAVRSAADLVFPRRCPVCDRPVRPFGALICPECVLMIERVEEPVCHRCGKPLHPDSGILLSGESGGLCRDCRKQAHIFERGCAVFTYHSAAGGIFRFKYGGRQEYGAWYGKCMAQRLLDLTAEGRGRAAFPIPDMLVPVPLSRRRLEKRGYNQAMILAGEISGYTGIPVREDVLRRVAETPPLKKMSFSERQNNLKKAFQAFGNDVKLKTIMLIDDIYTTGATMDACADALYRQGARSVCFMALATGADPV